MKIFCFHISIYRKLTKQNENENERMNKKKMNEILINSKKMLMATFANEKDENNHRG